ncbi:MAG: GAF domain-containing protein [Deltaproteobacteria bacterium]|nr:GAF domain-containing protein [Deltaproteobacteria bacterium]
MQNSQNQTGQVLRRLKEQLLSAGSAQAMLERVAEAVGAYLSCDQVNLHLQHQGLELRAFFSSLQRREPSGGSPLTHLASEALCIDGPLHNLPVFITDCDRSRVEAPLLVALKKQRILSAAILPIHLNGSVSGALECRYYNAHYRWSGQDKFVLEQCLEYLAFVLEGYGKSLGNGHSELQIEAPPASTDHQQRVRSRERYERLAKYGEVVIIRTSADFTIQEVTGDAKEILGFEAHELLGTTKGWRKFLHPEDLRRLQKTMAKLRANPEEMSEEVRIKHGEGKEHRWVMLKGVPLFKDGRLSGWEGFGIDVSERRMAQEELLQQSRRIEALYEVARATQLHFDPAVVMLKGLKALIKATGSDCGFGCFFDNKTKSIEIVAVDGLSQEYVDEVQRRINGPTILREVIEKKAGAMFDDIRDDPRALKDIVIKEGLRSTIAVPMLADDIAYGGIVLYCKEAGRYGKQDFELVNAAAAQICVSSRHAESYYVEKQQADSLAILYRISHELSKYVSAKEVAERAFPLIQRELACRRMWLGVLNEQGTHIVGQAGMGPGIRRRIVNVQIELYLRHDFLDEALRTKRPVIVKPNQEMECSGLNSIMRRLKVGSLVIVPLISLAQVVGVLVIEPASPGLHLVERKLPLLISMANEIATVLLARRFEGKMAEADKMRMAGMLASGVAHNFNNLLQAVMGQASLLEMQIPKDSSLNKSARMIIDAAGKGAALITQLLSFSAGESNKRRNISIDNVLNESRDLYKSILGSDINLEVDCRPDLPQILADFGQLQQVMTNLLVNAKEALASKNDGNIKISVSEIRLKSGEIDPELAPGSYIRIDVEDNGVGMDAERQSRCFEPFFTSKNIDTRTGLGFSGSGLGLSSAYSIMKQHEGLISVRSNPGEGSVFSLFFPVVTSKNSGMSHDMLYAGVASDSLDVLVYDLDDAISTAVRPILESVGLRSVATNRENRAMELLRRPSGKILAVLVDVDKSGYDMLPFLRSMRSEFSDMLILLYTRDPRRWARLLQGMQRVDVIEKPLGVWGIHALARRIASFKKMIGLGATVELQHVSKEDGGSAAHSPLESSSKPVDAQHD